MNIELPSVSKSDLTCDVIIAAHNDATTLPALLAGIPTRVVRSVVVVDNGSTDATAQVARDAGAVVVRESQVGYGAACNRGIAHLSKSPQSPQVVVFMTADGSYDPQDIATLLEPIAFNNAELVIGTRQRKGRRHSGRLALTLISALYRHKFEDLGPFRAIRYPAMVALAMADSGSGWNVEMQVKAVKLGLDIVEVPVSYQLQQQQRPAKVREMIDSMESTGRVLFQILRNAPTR